MRQSRKTRRATYADVLALPEHLVGEIVGGELFASPRPASVHTMAASRLYGRFEPLQAGGAGGPGGWWIVFEPELHLGSDVLVPDLAGWRLDRMPRYPEVPFFTLAPDWTCEVLSPNTARLDLALKLPKYARAGVVHTWVVDPIHRTLQVFRLAHAAWEMVAAFGADDRVRAEPFLELEFGLDALWPPRAGELEPEYPSPKRRKRAPRTSTRKPRSPARDRG